MNKAKKLPISTFELVWYILTGVVAIWGLTFIILGMIGMYAPVAASDNQLAIASASFKESFKFGFFGWGLIIFAIGALALSICLIVCSKSVDRETEKAARRAARLGNVKVNTPSETENK